MDHGLDPGALRVVARIARAAPHLAGADHDRGERSSTALGAESLAQSSAVPSTLDGPQHESKCVEDIKLQNYFSYLSEDVVQ